MNFSSIIPIFIWLLSAIGSSIICVLVTIIFQEQLKSFFFGILSIISKPPKRGIEGRWIATFSISRFGKIKQYNEIIEIKQRFGFVKGRIVVDERNYQELKLASLKHPLRLSGEVSESFYLTGYWFHPIETRRYLGAFQLKISPGGEKMCGKWVGFSETLNQIDSGEWNFVRDEILDN